MKLQRFGRCFCIPCLTQPLRGCAARHASRGGRPGGGSFASFIRNFCAERLIINHYLKNNISEPNKEISEIVPTTVRQGKTLEDDEDRFAASHAVDKDLSTSASADQSGQRWLKLEFGEMKFIHKIIIYSNFYTNWYNPLYSCALSTENFENCVNKINNVDVSVYKGEVKQKFCGTLQLTNGLEQSDQIYTLLCNTEGDTVKFSKSSGGPIQVYEVVITSKGKIKVKTFAYYNNKYNITKYKYNIIKDVHMGGVEA